MNNSNNLQTKTSENTEVYSKEQELNDIDFEIKKRLNWYYFDLSFSHLLSWGAIMSCLFSIYTLYMENTRYSVLGIIFSTAMIICDKTFNFSIRSKWWQIYLTDLQLIKNELIHSKITVYESQEKRIKLRKVNPLNIVHRNKLRNK